MSFWRVLHNSLEAFVGIGQYPVIDFWWRFLFFTFAPSCHANPFPHNKLYHFPSCLFPTSCFLFILFFCIVLNHFASNLSLVWSLFVFTLLENAWTNHYNLPPNSTLGGLHMAQTTHDCVEWPNPIKNSPKWSCSGKQWWFKNLLFKMPLGIVENFSFHFSNHFGGFSYWSFQVFCIRLTTLYTR
jgi:hypothetical protein